MSESIKGYIKFNDNLNTVVTENPSNKVAVLNIMKSSFELGWYDMALDSCNYLLEIEPENAEAQQLLEKIMKHNPPIVGFIKRLIKEANKGNE